MPPEASSAQKTTEVVTPLSPDVQWNTAVRAKLAETGKAIGAYGKEQNFQHATDVLILLTQCGADLLVNTPPGVSGEAAAGAKQGFIGVHNRVVDALVADQTTAQTLRLPTSPSVPEQWTLQIREHLGAVARVIEILKQGQMPTTEQIVTVGLRLSAMGGLAVAAVPTGMEQQAEAYKKLYAKVGPMLAQKLREEAEKLGKAGAIEEKTSVVPETSVPLPVAEQVDSLHPLTPERLTKVMMDDKLLREVGAMQTDGPPLATADLMALPESFLSQESRSGARTETKGGQIGAGAERRFTSLFCAPVDERHPEMVGWPKNTLREHGEQVRAHRALAEVVGLAFTKHGGQSPLVVDRLVEALGEQPKDVRGALIFLRTSVLATAQGRPTSLSSSDVRLLQRLIGSVAQIDEELERQNPSNIDARRFFGLADAATKHHPSHEANQRWMNVVSDVMTKPAVMEKLGLTQLLPPHAG